MSNEALICPIMVRIDFSEVVKAARTPKAMIATLVINKSDENLFWLFFCIGFQDFFTSDVALTGRM